MLTREETLCGLPGCSQPQRRDSIGHATGRYCQRHMQAYEQRRHILMRKTHSVDHYGYEDFERDVADNPALATTRKSKLVVYATCRYPDCDQARLQTDPSVPAGNFCKTHTDEYLRWRSSQPKGSGVSKFLTSIRSTSDPEPKSAQPKTTSAKTVLKQLYDIKKCPVDSFADRAIVAQLVQTGYAEYNLNGELAITIRGMETVERDQGHEAIHFLPERDEGIIVQTKVSRVNGSIKPEEKPEASDPALGECSLRIRWNSVRIDVVFQTLALRDLPYERIEEYFSMVGRQVALMVMSDYGDNNHQE